MPLFSVIIPTYNRAALLMEALASVERQSCDDYEIIVVDDGGADDTAARVAQSYPQARLVRQSNSGVGVARNLGAQHAIGDWLAFLDSDDLWFPWALESLRGAIERHAPAVVFFAVVKFERPEQLNDVRPAPQSERVYDDVLSLDDRALFSGGCALAVRKDAFWSCAGFANVRVSAEDHDFVMRLGTTGKLVVVTQPALVAYRMHPVSMSKEARKMYRGLCFVLERESHGHYPGGDERKPDRLRAISETMRGGVAQFVFQRQWGVAARLYLRNVPLFVRTRRWRSLFGLPLLPALFLLGWKRAPR